MFGGLLQGVNEATAVLQVSRWELTFERMGLFAKTDLQVCGGGWCYCKEMALFFLPTNVSELLMSLEDRVVIWFISQDPLRYTSRLYVEWLQKMDLTRSELTKQLCRFWTFRWIFADNWKLFCNKTKKYPHSYTTQLQIQVQTIASLAIGLQKWARCTHVLEM